MFIYECLRKPSRLMVKQSMKASLICLDLFFEIVSLNGNLFLQHLHYIFTNLEQTFYKQYRIEKNDKQIYMNLWSMKEEEECVEVYYEQVFKLVNHLQIKATDMYFTTISRLVYFSTQNCQ